MLSNVTQDALREKEGTGKTGYTGALRVKLQRQGRGLDKVAIGAEHPAIPKSRKQLLR